MVEKKMHPVHEAFFKMCSPPLGRGNDYIKPRWIDILCLVPLLGYLLFYIKSPLVDRILFVYSLMLVVFCYGCIYAAKTRLAYHSNPFDFVKVCMMFFIAGVIFWGVSFFFLFRIDPAQLLGVNGKSLFDFIYFSFVTVATLGYGDIVPNAKTSKMLVILEVLYGVWFLVTVLPVAVADQAERIRHHRIARQKFDEELNKAIEKGEFKKVYDSGEEKKNEPEK